MYKTFKQFLQESSAIGSIVRLTKGPHKGKNVKVVGHSADEKIWTVREVKDGKPVGKQFSVNKGDHLTEAAVRRNDPAMDDYYDTDPPAKPQQPMAEGPYAVGWSAQSHEWYGDGPPASGDGRYKPKGDGGRWVAINVPSYQVAKQLADHLDAAYEAKQFPNESVYAKHGRDWYVLEYYGAHVIPMSKMSEYDLESARDDKAKDYAAK